MRTLAPALVLALVAVAACSGGDAPPAQSPQPSATPAPSASASAHVDPVPEDPNESAAPIVLEVLVGKGAKPKFPKATVADKDCWKDMPLTGKHDKDWNELVGRCGAPTGMVEYVKPSVGRLHHHHDKRDIFVMKVHRGQCYRVFAVGDGDVKDMDIRITKPNGSLLEDDKTDSPAAIIHNASPWCAEDEQDLHFHVQIESPSKGHYTFGAWVRPKK